MVMPNFLIIGAAKSGTTSLYKYLKEHPQIYMSPVKEPKFFGLEEERLNFCGPDSEKANRSVITDIKSYLALFQGVSNETAIGEASPWYLYLQKSPIQIQKYIPTIKLIAILRNPVDRAYSGFLHQVRLGYEPLSDFAQALQEEEARTRNNWRPGWYYKQLGFYYSQLSRYFETFDQSQIKVYLYEEFCKKPVDVLQDIFRFLGVDDTFIPDVSKRYNVGSTSKNQKLNALIKRPNTIKSILKSFLPARLCQQFRVNLHKINSSAKPQLSQEVRKQLIEEYREDILKLQKLIQQDLSEWLT